MSDIYEKLKKIVREQKITTENIDLFLASIANVAITHNALLESIKKSLEEHKLNKDFSGKFFVTCPNCGCTTMLSAHNCHLCDHSLLTLENNNLPVNGNGEEPKEEKKVVKKKTTRKKKREKEQDTVLVKETAPPETEVIAPKKEVKKVEEKPKDSIAVVDLFEDEPEESNDDGWFGDTETKPEKEKIQANSELDELHGLGEEDWFEVETPKKKETKPVIEESSDDDFSFDSAFDDTVAEEKPIKPEPITKKEVEKDLEKADSLLDSDWEDEFEFEADDLLSDDEFNFDID